MSLRRLQSIVVKNVSSEAGRTMAVDPADPRDTSVACSAGAGRMMRVDTGDTDSSESRRRKVERTILSSSPGASFSSPSPITGETASLVACSVAFSVAFTGEIIFSVACSLSSENARSDATLSDGTAAAETSLVAAPSSLRSAAISEVASRSSARVSARSSKAKEKLAERFQR